MNQNSNLPAAAVEHSAAYPTNQENLEPATRRENERGHADPEISAFLLRISREIEQIDRERRLAIVRSQLKAHQYYDGNFYGYVDENNNWIQRSRAEGEMWYSDNQYYPYIRTALMEMNRRQTEIVINPAVQSEKMKMIANFAQERYNANRERTFTELLKQTENNYAVLNGIVFRYTYFEFNVANGRREKIPRLRKNQTQKTEAYACADCGTPRADVPELTGDGFAKTPCAKCGSEMVQMTPGESEQPEVIIGYEELPQGENRWVSVNPVGVIVSMQASCIEETPFIKWKQPILRSVLEVKFPNITLPSTGRLSHELNYINNQSLATPGGDYMSDGTMVGEQKAVDYGNEMEILEFEQVWLDYPVYCNKKFRKDQRLANGKVLKAGQKLGSMFPKGMYFAHVGELVVDTWNEAKNQKWTSSPYSLRAGSMYGAGTTPAHADQEMINDQKALQMSNMWNNAVAREFVNPDKITEISVDPAVPTEVKGLDAGEHIIGSAYAQAAPAPLSAEVYRLEETAKGSMQNKIGAMSNAAGGLADSQKWGDTATAISIKRDLAVGRFAPDLALLADQLDRLQAYQFLENEQQFFTPSQWQNVQGDYNEEAVKGFVACDIRRDLIATVVPGSYMPRSDSQRISQITGYANVAPALAQMANPELLAYVGEVFNVPQHLMRWDADRVFVDRLIERFTALAREFIEAYGDAPDSDLNNPKIRKVATEIGLASQIPVDAFLDSHDSICEALRDWRATDEGRNAPNILVAAVSLRFEQHQRAKLAQAVEMKRLADEAMQPDVDAANEAAAAEEEKQLALAVAERKLDAEADERKENMEIIKGLSDKEERELDRQNQLAIATARQAQTANDEPQELETAVGM